MNFIKPPASAAPPVFVLDASVAVAWAVPPRYMPYGHRVQLRLALGTSATVATNWPLDVFEAWLQAVARNETTQRRVDAFLARLPSYRLAIDADGPARVWPEVVALARAHNLPVRDAAYLELALRLALPLATTAPALLSAAPAAGVLIFTP